MHGRRSRSLPGGCVLEDHHPSPPRSSKRHKEIIITRQGRSRSDEQGKRTGNSEIIQAWGDFSLNMAFGITLPINPRLSNLFIVFDEWQVLSHGINATTCLGVIPLSSRKFDTKTGRAIFALLDLHSRLMYEVPPKVQFPLMRSTSNYSSLPSTTEAFSRREEGSTSDVRVSIAHSARWVEASCLKRGRVHPINLPQLE